MEKEVSLIEYRGIKLNESVNLYKKDGSYNETVKRGLDALADKLVETGHIILSEYVGNRDKVLIDFKCDHAPQWVEPLNYKNEHGCFKCGGKCPEQANEDLILLVEQNGHELLSEYVRAMDGILIDFKCGHEPHWISPSKYKNGRGCPKCGDISTSEKQSQKAREDFPLLVKENGHRWIDGEYKNNRTKVLIDFMCGHDPHWIIPNAYKNEIGCPICHESKGEKRVRKWLDDGKLKFEAQMTFDGLLGIGGKSLSYDFYLPKQSILIEYQGGQHERFVKGIHKSKKDFHKQQEHDRRKREYAKLHKIKLLEIWYWDFDNVEEILNMEVV